MINLSKLLSYVLRHNSLGLEIENDGFINVNELLSHNKFKNFTIQDIEKLVKECPKQRFLIEQRQGNLFIRANQGHSLNVNVKMTVLTTAPPIVVHGTSTECYQLIKKTGLSRMNRLHIHFAKGLPKEQSIKSGMRTNCEVYIYIDTEKAINDGIKFYESDNGVILTSGLSGILSTEYFRKVTDNKGNLLN